MEISLDALVASLVLVTVFLLGATAYHDLVSAEITTQHYAACLAKALHYSELLMNEYLGSGGEVSCDLVPSAYQKLRGIGFTGEISCGEVSRGDGEGHDVKIVRKGYDPLRGVVEITVSVC